MTISTRGYGEISFGKLGENYTISKYIPDLKVELMRVVVCVRAKDGKRTFADGRRLFILFE